jgi:hypothetical protein
MCDCTKQYDLITNPQCAIGCLLEQYAPRFQQAFKDNLGGVQTAVTAILQDVLQTAQASIGEAQKAFGDDLPMLENAMAAASADALEKVKAALKEAENTINNVLAHESSFFLHLYATDVAWTVTLILLMGLFPSLFQCFPDWMVISIATALVLSMPNDWFNQLQQYALPAMISTLGVTIILNRKKCLYVPK